MQYGYFDDANKEYVITRPDTPRSWTNYLGDTNFGSVITNNAGGYAFYKSAGRGRFLRFRFNSIPMDQPGRYFYLRDNDSGDFWTSSWQPVAKLLDEYKSEVRFGTGYAKFKADYAAIKAETLYFVPLGRNFECWRLKISNSGKTTRKLSVFSFVEYPGNWNAVDDLLNLQYTQYTVKMDVIDSIVDHGTNVFIPSMPNNFEEKDQGRHTFMAMVGSEVTGYDTDREAFLGPYRTYTNPLIVENGGCTNSLATGDNACGVLQTEIELQPGESRELAVFIGIGTAGIEGKAVRDEFSDLSNITKEFQKLKTSRHADFEGFSARTPDSAFNSMVNVWNPYNCLITFNWSRAASLIYTADERDGLGYRDSVQDLMGVIHNIPDEACKRLELLISGQLSNGGALPVVSKTSHRPGQESVPDEGEFRSDDALWLFNAVPLYAKESGDISFYEKIISFADKGEASVLNHLRKAIEFSMERRGAHGLTCGLKADWNDCLQLGKNGESVFVSLQLRFALQTYIDICEKIENRNETRWAQPLLKEIDEKISQNAWDGEWFLRAYRDDGLKFGSKENDEGQIFLNPQSWAVISGHADSIHAKVAMDIVAKRLYSEYGVAICDPAFEKTDFKVVRATLMSKGMKENGGIFQHTQGWAVMAEAILGNGSRAWQYFKATMPAAYNDRSDIRQIEPYVYGQSTHSKYSPRCGASRIPWLTGAASWAYFAATQYILGIRPDYEGLIIDPAIPCEWKGFQVTRHFRGKTLNIEVKNPDGVEKGVKQITLNNENIPGYMIPESKMKKENKVIVILGTEGKIDF